MRPALLIFLLALLASGCGRKATPTTPSAPARAKPSASPLKSEAAVETLCAAIICYQKAEGDFPPSLEALVRKGLVEKIPDAPAGTKFVYQPENGSLALVFEGKPRAPAAVEKPRQESVAEKTSRPTNNRKTPRVLAMGAETLPSGEIGKLFFGSETTFFDRNYWLPDDDWLNRFNDRFFDEVTGKNDISRARGWDCDKWARFYQVEAMRAYARQDNRPAESIAIGVIVYQKGGQWLSNGQSHCVNVIIMRDGSARFIEPQTLRRKVLTPEERQQIARVIF